MLYKTPTRHSPSQVFRMFPLRKRQQSCTGKTTLSAKSLRHRSPSKTRGDSCKHHLMAEAISGPSSYSTSFSHSPATEIRNHNCDFCASSAPSFCHHELSSMSWRQQSSSSMTPRQMKTRSARTAGGWMVAACVSSNFVAM